MKSGLAKKNEKGRDASPYLPPSPRASIAEHRRAAEKCRGCDLYKNATQVVFGEGQTKARMMLIGEQPGDLEDLQGRPFVGPAGKLLDRALDELGLDRSSLYVTNAVKHFKWKPAPRGKRRLHSKPGAREIHACLPWLEREILLIKPAVIVCLGATAGQALLGRQFRLGQSRGTVLRNSNETPPIIATTHPSALLRIPDHQEREKGYQAFLADLRLANQFAGGSDGGFRS